MPLAVVVETRRATAYILSKPEFEMVFAVLS